jgi:hypothetical protein
VNNPIIYFVGIVVGLLIFAPIMLKVFLSIQTPISNGVVNLTGGTEAAAGWNAVMTPLTTMWDKVILFAFITTTLLLFVSAFFIDTHPVWIVLYIFSNFILVLFLPGLLGITDTFYESANFATEQGMLPFTDSLRTHATAWILGIMVVGGILIYGKFAFIGNSGSPRGGGFR